MIATRRILLGDPLKVLRDIANRKAM